jgi:Uma2 family endonuclease
MPVNAAAKLSLTEAEYLAFERDAETRHEFVNGELVAMAGGTPLHAAVSGAVFLALGSRLRGQPCRPYNSDLRVHLASTGLYCYPDVTVVCGSLELHPDDRNVVRNPSVVVEVYSPSTQSYDQGQKAAHYRQCPSIQSILLVDPIARTVEHYARLDANRWELERLGLAGTLKLPVLNLEVPVAELFADTDTERDAERVAGAFATE